jgi:hypothetical protein
MSVVSSMAKPPCILGGPCTRDSPGVEADVPELLHSSGVAFVAPGEIEGAALRQSEPLLEVSDYAVTLR